MNIYPIPQCWNIIGDQSGLSGTKSGTYNLSTIGTLAAGDTILAPNLGDEKLTNGTFTGSATGWTLGTGWNYNTNLIRKDVNGTGTLSQTSAAMITPLVVGEYYTLTYVLSNCSYGFGGTLIPTIAGVTLRTALTDAGDGTYTQTFQALNTNDLVFTPSNSSRFYIDSISLKKTAGNLSTKNIYNSESITSDNGIFNTLYAPAIRLPSGSTDFSVTNTTGSGIYFTISNLGVLDIWGLNVLYVSNFGSDMAVGDTAAQYPAASFDNFVGWNCTHSINYGSSEREGNVFLIHDIDGQFGDIRFGGAYGDSFIFGVPVHFDENVTFGNASTDIMTFTGGMVPRTTASDPQHATPASRPAGTVKEIAYYNGEWYGCTNASTPTWVKFTAT